MSKKTYELTKEMSDALAADPIDHIAVWWANNATPEEQKAAEARKAAQEAEAAAVEKVQAAAPTKAVAAPQAVKAQPQEQTFPQFTFTVFNCTRSQLLEIRDYLRQKGIQYK